MKKVIALIIILSLICTLAACGQQSNDTPNPNPNGTIERTGEPEEYPPVNIVPGVELEEPDELPENDNNSSVVWVDGISFVELAPASETVRSEKIEVAAATSFIYNITYGRCNLTLEFGLRAADGTEYSREIVGGSDRGVIEDIPAGSYDLFVRNSGDYSELPSYKDKSVSYNATGAINYSLGD